MTLKVCTDTRLGRQSGSFRVFFPGVRSMRGAAFLELAILLPPLIILASLIAMTGKVLYEQSQLTKAVEAATRYMARGYEILDDTCSQQNPAWGNAQAAAINLLIYGNDSAPVVENLTASNITVTAFNTLPDGITAGCRVEIDVSNVAFNSVFGTSLTPIIHVGPVTLNARSEERYIGS